MATITIQTRTGNRETPTVWRGKALAVHRPPSAKNPSGFSTEPKRWAITHHPSGLAACASFDGPKADAIALAKLWDAAFCELAADNPDARSWRYSRTWLEDCKRAQLPASLNLPRPVGPVLPDHPTPSDVGRAIAAAVDATYAPPTQAEAAEQFPAGETVPANRLRTCDGILQLRWRGQWWDVPTVGEVEAWTFDSVCESPTGDSVEPDHPESWLSILGII
jgi:hypothetical protein